MFQLFCVISFLWILSVTKAEPPVPQYGVPFSNNNPPISSYGTPNYNVNNDQQSHDHGGEPPKAYEFGYQVKDDYSGNNFGRQERSDGNQVTGEYRVQLPDGRTQIVTYYADWQTGYHADVRYEGEPHYPDQFNGPNLPPGVGPNPNQYGPPLVGPGAPNPNQFGPHNQVPPPNQYGPPGVGPVGNQGVTVGQYKGNDGYDYNAPGRSSVSIKDFSSGADQYRSSSYNGVNDGVNFSGNYDGFGSRNRPGNVYGAP